MSQGYDSRNGLAAHSLPSLGCSLSLSLSEGERDRWFDSPLFQQPANRCYNGFVGFVGFVALVAPPRSS